MKIIISVKDVYGVRKYYPVCETAKLFAEIANTKTLTEATLLKIKCLGYAIAIEPIAEVV